MKGAYAIARHELLRRLPLLLVGLALGLLPFAFAGDDPSQLAPLADMLVTIGVVVCWIVAFTTGLALIGRPLHDGRLSFYFTRPITSAGIVIGKVVGGLLAIVVMHVALVVPLAILLANRIGVETPLAQPALLVGVAFFVVGLVVGILARSRSRWFVVDVAGAGVAAVVAVIMFGGLGSRKTEIAMLPEPDIAEALLHRADIYLYAIVVAAAFALVVSVVVAITRGRTDRDLVHRGLSITLWPALTIIGVVGLVLAQWGLQ